MINEPNVHLTAPPPSSSAQTFPRFTRLVQQTQLFDLTSSQPSSSQHQTIPQPAPTPTPATPMPSNTQITPSKGSTSTTKAQFVVKGSLATAPYNYNPPKPPAKQQPTASPFAPKLFTFPSRLFTSKVKSCGGEVKRCLPTKHDSNVEKYPLEQAIEGGPEVVTEPHRIYSLLQLGALLPMRTSENTIPVSHGSMLGGPD